MRRILAFVAASTTGETALNDDDGPAPPLWRTVGESHEQVERMALDAEGIIPAPESAHAIRVAIDEALKCRASGEKKVIAFNLSGHGHFVMTAYEAYHQGKLEDCASPDALVQEAMTHLPKVPAMA